MPTTLAPIVQHALRYAAPAVVAEALGQRVRCLALHEEGGDVEWEDNTSANLAVCVTAPMVAGEMGFDAVPAEHLAADELMAVTVATAIVGNDDNAALRRKVDEGIVEARRIIATRGRAIALLTRRLVDRRYLTGDEVRTIIGSAKGD
jgi:hypothetical protein